MNANIMKAPPGSRLEQRGAALVVSMLLLLVMTILALSMSQTTRLQERMAGNSRDAALAFQGAESGLRGAEDYLEGLTARPEDCSDPTSCVVVQRGTFDTTDLARQNDAWWEDNASEYGTADTTDIPGIAADPKYVIEYYGDTKSGLLTIGRGAEHRKVFYKATARSHGATKTAEAVAESVYAFIE